MDTRSAMRSQRRSFSSMPRRCGASSSTSASSNSRGLWLSTSEVYANGRPSVPSTSRTIDVLPVTGGPCTNIGIAWSCGSPINPRSCEICSRRSGHRAQRSSLTSAAGAAPAAIAPARVTGGTSFPRSNQTLGCARPGRKTSNRRDRACGNAVSNKCRLKRKRRSEAICRGKKKRPSRLVHPRGERRRASRAEMRRREHRETRESYETSTRGRRISCRRMNVWWS